MVISIDVLWPQSDQCVGPHQQRKIGELAAKVRLVPLVVDQKFCHGEEYGRGGQCETG